MCKSSGWLFSLTLYFCSHLLSPLAFAGGVCVCEVGLRGRKLSFGILALFIFPVSPPHFNSVDEKPLPTPCTHADTPPSKQKGMYKDFSDFEITKAPPLQSLAPPLCDGKQILALVLGLLRL